MLGCANRCFCAQNRGHSGAINSGNWWSHRAQHNAKGGCKLASMMPRLHKSTGVESFGRRHRDGEHTTTYPLPPQEHRGVLGDSGLLFANQPQMSRLASTLTSCAHARRTKRLLLQRTNHTRSNSRSLFSASGNEMVLAYKWEHRTKANGAFPMVKLYYFFFLFF